jgi:hypothetical protein
MRWPEALARAAVERWERSGGFHLGVADQSVRVALDAKQFPMAWQPGGHDERESLNAGVLTLEREGLAQVRRSGRGALATERAVVLSAEAVEMAYAELQELGLPTRRAHARQMLTAVEQALEGASGWAAEYLAATGAQLKRGRFTLLGRGAQEPSSASDVRDSMRVMVRLEHHEPYDERSLSGELFGETKRLHDLRPRVRHMLLVADPYWKNEPPPSDRVLWSRYGEVFKLPFTAVATSAHLPGVADFALFRPYALLPRTMLERLADWIVGSGTRPTVTTIENATNFIRYIEEDDVRRAIAAGMEIVLFSEGFASDDLLCFVGRLRGCPARHWGDTDVHGIRIAEFIGRAAGGLDLFRATGEWVDGLPVRLGQRLLADHRRALEQIVEQGLAPHVRGANRLATAVLQREHWFEQEVFYSRMTAEERACE